VWKRREHVSMGRGGTLPDVNKVNAGAGTDLKRDFNRYHRHYAVHFNPRFHIRFAQTHRQGATPRRSSCRPRSGQEECKVG